MSEGLQALMQKHADELEIEQAAHRGALALCEVYEQRIAALEQAQQAAAGLVLDLPDAPGWWAFEGAEWESKGIYPDGYDPDEDKRDDWGNESTKPIGYEDVKGKPFQTVLFVRYSRKVESIWFRRQSGPYDGEPILGYIMTHHPWYNGLNGLEKLTGKWTRLHIPWERTTSDTVSVAPNSLAVPGSNPEQSETLAKAQAVPIVNEGDAIHDNQ